jgi:cell division protein FtsB
MRRVLRISEPAVERLAAARRQLATIALICVAVWLLVHAFISPNGVMAYQDKKAEYRDLQKDVQSLHEQNAKIEAQNEALKNNDPKAIEKEAREQLRYAKPGEIIYVAPEPKRQPTPDTHTAEVQTPPAR